MSSVLLIERDRHVATVTLNRPEQRNALSAELRHSIGNAFRELGREEEVRVVVLTGVGQSFCAGMDLKELSSGTAGATGHDTAVAGQAEMAEGIAAFGGPIIAAVNGHAVTGGFELALACDLIIASTNAKFADTHARVGMLPGWGLSQKLPRLIGVARAKEISFSGNAIDAATAYDWGLVNRVVAPEELLSTCLALARDMASCVPHVLRGYKRLIDDGYGMPLPEALAFERRVAIESAKATSAATIASRRGEVQKRGRER